MQDRPCKCRKILYPLFMSETLSTPAIIAQALAFQAALLPDAFIGDSSPATECARKVAAAMIDGALFRDLNAAMVKTAKAQCKADGEEFLYGGAPYTLLANDSYKSDGGREAPKHYTEQCSWRDYTGYLCKTERMAKWVAAWVAKYLDPRDADGNPSTGRVNEIHHDDKPSQWLAVTGSYKVAD